MESRLYLRDAYRKEFDAVVARSLSDAVVLDTTVFYPGGGGQPCDRGELLGSDGRRWPVDRVETTELGLAHRLSGSPPPEAARLHGAIDWDLRYGHMRHHTCLHILSGVVFHRFGSVITGNQIYSDRARMDLNLADLSPGMVSGIIDEANAVVRRSTPVTVRFCSRAEAEADPTLVRVARELMPYVEEVRLIDIEGFDVQADGGTHVANSREVGEVRLSRTENKGARNKRIYVTLGPTSSPG